MVRCSKCLLASAALVAAATLSSAAFGVTPLPYSTGFEQTDFTPGGVNGQGGWTVDGTTAAVVTNSPAAAHSGSQGLLVAPTNDGVVEKVSSPGFAPSGETPSMYNPTPASSFMSEGFWFRTVATSTDTGLYVSNSLSTPASVRNTWFGLGEGVANFGAPSDGGLYAAAYDTDASGNFREYVSLQLSWGTWYHAQIDEQYVNGPYNDVVTYTITDGSNNTVWTATTGSWETYYTNNPGAEQAPGPVVSDHATFGGDTGQGIYVDDFTMSNVPTPEPTTLGIVALGAVALLNRRRKA